MAVALLALFVALSGAGVAATGGNFILGQSNSADATSDLGGSVAGPELRVTNSNTGGIAIRGRRSATTGGQPAVQGDTVSTSAAATGVYGLVSSGSSAGDSNGVQGVNSGAGRGVYGQSASGYGVYGKGKFGLVGTGSDTGAYATSASATGSGVYGQDSSSGNGVYGKSTSGYGVRGDGKFGLVGFGSDSGVWATSSNSAGSGVYGQNTGGGVGIHGQSGNGQGVYGESTYQAGVKGFSNSFDGVYGDSHGANSAGVSGHGGLFGLWGSGHIGVHAESSDGGPAFDASGDAVQNRAGGGWVKAMAYVSPNYPAGQQVRQCFNSQLAPQASCGITATGVSVGYWLVDFGFDVTDRFVMLTPNPAYRTDNGYAVTSACTDVCNGSSIGSTKVAVTIAYSASGDHTNTGFWIIVF